MKLVKYGLLSLAAFSTVASAQNSLKYFGYFANNNYVAENYDHTNIEHVGVFTGTSDRGQDTTAIMMWLSAAKAKGVQVMLQVDPFVLLNGGAGCPYGYQPMAAQYWGAFVDQLVGGGYLVPGDPARSTVVAFYPVDEPELCGLGDVNGAANPALANAINAIRSDARTADFPLAVVLSKQYSKASAGIKLFDWVGMDNYSLSDNDYISAIGGLENSLDRNRQRVILVPQAATGGPLDGSYNSPTAMYDYAHSDPMVVMLMPFLWAHDGWSGTRDIPALRTAYTSIGNQIKSGASPPPSLHIQSYPNTCTMYAGQGSCAVTITWNSNRGDAQITVQSSDGTGPRQLFAAGQSGSQRATWITANSVTFRLQSSLQILGEVKVVGVASSSPPPSPPGGGGGPCFNAEPTTRAALGRPVCP